MIDGKALIKRLLNGIDDNKIRVKTVTTTNTNYGANGRGTLTVNYTGIPSTARMLGYSIVNTPNAHWFRGIISNITYNSLSLNWHNEYTAALSGTWTILLIYTNA